MNADVKQTTKVSAHVETSGWGKVVLNSVISLPQRHSVLNQWQRSITRSVYNMGSCLRPPISLIMDLQCNSKSYLQKKIFALPRTSQVLILRLLYTAITVHFKFYLMTQI